MQIPVSVAFDKVDVSDVLERTAWEHAERLERSYPRITSCRVTIGRPHRRGRKGALWSVRIDITVPGAELVVNREHRFDHAHENPYVALRDAFLAARRQLDAYGARQRGREKHHEPMPVGRIARLLPDFDGGFIEAPDGREIFFHRHAVLEADFEDLQPGDEVRFAEEDGIDGPQASSVHVAATGRAAARHPAEPPPDFRDTIRHPRGEWVE